MEDHGVFWLGGFGAQRDRHTQLMLPRFEGAQPYLRRSAGAAFGFKESVPSVAIGVIKLVLQHLFVMNLVPWIDAHRFWSSRLTNVVWYINSVIPSQSCANLETRSKSFHTTQIPQRRVADPIVTTTLFGTSSSANPKRMSEIPGRNEEKARGAAAVPIPSARYI